MHELQIEWQRFQDVQVLRLRGPVEVSGFATLVATVRRFIFDDAPCLVLDCHSVTYIGSAQLNELLDIAREARARGGDIKCVGLSPTIQQVANLIASGDPMDCYEELSDALASFRASPAFRH